MLLLRWSMIQEVSPQLPCQANDWRYSTLALRNAESRNISNSRDLLPDFNAAPALYVLPPNE